MLTHYQNAHPEANHLFLALFTFAFIFTLNIVCGIYFIDIFISKSTEIQISVLSLILSVQIVACVSLCISRVRQILKNIEKINSKTKSMHITIIKIFISFTKMIACIHMLGLIKSHDPIYAISKIILLIIFMVFMDYFISISEKILLDKVGKKYLNKSISEFIGFSKFIFPGFLVFALALNFINIIFRYSYIDSIYVIGIVFECIFDILLIFIIVFSSRFFNNFRSVPSGL